MINHFDWLFANELVYSQELVNAHEVIDSVMMNDQETLYFVVEGNCPDDRELSEHLIISAE